MAAGLLIGLMAPMLYQLVLGPDRSGPTQIPESYVGALADRRGKQAIAYFKISFAVAAAASLRDGIFGYSSSVRPEVVLRIMMKPSCE